MKEKKYDLYFENSVKVKSLMMIILNVIKKLKNTCLKNEKMF